MLIKPGSSTNMSGRQTETPVHPMTRNKSLKHSLTNSLSLTLLQTLHEAVCE